VLSYYTLYIGKKYEHGANWIALFQADNFSLNTNTETGGSDLHFKIHVEVGDSFRDPMEVVLNAYVVRFT
jgi:hypothetical protein